MKEPAWLTQAIANAAREGRVKERAATTAALVAIAHPPTEVRSLWTEDEFTAAAIHQFHYFGWTVAHFRTAMTSRGEWTTAVAGDGKGFPDCLAVRDGWMIAAELKVKRNKPSAEQQDWLAKFALIPQTLARVWYPHDWDTMTLALENPHAQVQKLRRRDRMGKDPKR